MNGQNEAMMRSGSVEGAIRLTRSKMSLTGKVLITAAVTATVYFSMVGCSSVAVLKSYRLNTIAEDVAVSRDGSTFYYYDYHMSDIVAVNTQTGAPAKAAHVPALGALVVSHDGRRLFGVPTQGVKFAVVDTATLEPTSPVIVTPSVPRAMSAAPDDSRIYVANQTGQVTLVEARTGRTITLPGAADPTDIESSATNVYVADAATRTVVVLTATGAYQGEIDLPKNDHGSVVAGNDSVESAAGSPTTSLSAAITPDGRALLVIDTARGELYIIDLVSNSVISTLTVNNGGSSAIEMSATGRVAYIASAQDRSITEVDVANRTVMKRIGLGFTPGPASEVPGGHFLLVPCVNDETVSLVAV